jgi:phosphoenolpyruvate phosphomutase
MKAIILNSGIGSRLKEYTKNNPKSMVQISNNETIFSKAMNLLKEYDIDEFIITTGYLNDVLKEYILNNFPNLKFTFVHNPVYDSTNYIKSIDFIDDFNDDTLLLHGDLVFDKEVLEMVISSGKSCVVVDSSLDIPKKDFKAKVVEGNVKKISVNYFGEDAFSCQPLYKLVASDWILWKNKIHEFCEAENTNVYAEEALNELLNEEFILDAMDVKGYYCSEIDTVKDLENYKKLRRNMDD